MKRFGLILIAVALAVNVYAAPPTSVASYFSGAVIVPASYTNAGDTGLTVTNAYVCIPVTTLAVGEFASASTTNDVRGLVSSIVSHLASSIAGMTSTNRFTSYTISETVQYTATGSNRTSYRAISEVQNVTITPSYPTD